MNPKKLGSLQHAIKTANKTWLNRGFHSKNSTFPVWNYFTNSPLYFKPISQKGQDERFDEQLYEGTSKSAEHAALLLLVIAKDESLKLKYIGNMQTHLQASQSKKLFHEPK